MCGACTTGRRVRWICAGRRAEHPLQIHAAMRPSYVVASSLVLALVPGRLAAQPAPSPEDEPTPTEPVAPEEPPPPPQPEAPPPVTVVAAPGQESGQVVAEEYEPSVARTVARGALYVPKTIVVVVTAPFRGSVWLYDRYALRDLYYRTFYNDDRTFGIIPIVVFATGFGIMGGARLISTDTFGGNEQLTIEGAYGGNYQERASIWLDSGARFDPVLLTIGGNFDRFARLRFAGIGNADLSPMPETLIDPLTDPTAVKSYYRYQELRAAASADWRALDDLHLIGRGAITDLTFDPSTHDPAIDTVYNPADLVGFMDGVEHLYGELELRWDRRGIAVPRWETTPYTTGWLASAFVGGIHALDDTSDFARYGFDLQAFLHLALGPRMLGFRLRGEGVTGDVDEVPFSELPYLGGDILRGYDFARFRDRVAVVGTAQYTWDLSRYTNAFLFTDVGRVYHSLDDLTFDDLRLGYGGGIELHSTSELVLAGTLASSIDGGVFVTARMTALWDKVPRWR
jgi:hypothetical protein